MRIRRTGPILSGMMQLANHNSEFDIVREVLALLACEPQRACVQVIAEDLRIRPIYVSHALGNIREAGFGLSWGGPWGNRVAIAKESAETAQEVASNYIEALYE